MSEWRLFPEGTIPEYTKPEWYEGRDHAPHLEEGGGHRDRLLLSASLVAQSAFTIKAGSVVDLGAGDGGLLSLLGPAIHAWGYDLMPENIKAAKDRGVDVRYGDVVEAARDDRGRFDNTTIEYGRTAVCTEMLEHLVDPHGFLCDLAPHVEALVCSSPHDEMPGLAYEYHTWAWDLAGYRALLEQAGFRILRQHRVHRFQVLLAMKS
jgi:2-polyprenyl-3-methyl-5-hydroxy-6-metoxy-1,4-benzoquinol methylase